MSTKEYTAIKEVIEEFLRDTQMPYSMLEPWNIINQYFTIEEKQEEDPIVYMLVGNKKYSLGSHSTLDYKDAKNFIVYMRVLCKNLLLGKRKYESS